MHVGIDFDNTIAAYDALFAFLAVEEGILPPMPVADKTTIRDAVRANPDGEMAWQHLQALAYGPRMGDAELMPNVDRFFRTCRESGIKVSVVSHKTQFPADCSVSSDLRKAAWSWMSEQGFFSEKGFGLSAGDIIFESSRRKKIGRIKGLACTHFVDDLDEVFFEDGFPDDVRRMLYAPNGRVSGNLPFEMFHSWNEITHELLGS